MAKNSSDTLITTVEDWFKKLPNLPKNIQEVIVTITPWIALIFGILGVLGGVAGLGILTAFSPVLVLGGSAYSTGTGIISVILGLASAALLLMAFSGTKAKKLKGWNFLFWSEAVNVVAALIAFSVGGVVFSLIGFYLIFQIKSYYK